MNDNTCYFFSNVGLNADTARQLTCYTTITDAILLSGGPYITMYAVGENEVLPPDVTRRDMTDALVEFGLWCNTRMGTLWTSVPQYAAYLANPTPESLAAAIQAADALLQSYDGTNAFLFLAATMMVASLSSVSAACKGNQNVIKCNTIICIGMLRAAAACLPSGLDSVNKAMEYELRRLTRLYAHCVTEVA